jgi:hypothetical protein
MRGLGTAEALIEDVGVVTRSRQWRKPLRPEEYAQMALTGAVRERRGRG